MLENKFDVRLDENNVEYVQFAEYTNLECRDALARDIYIWMDEFWILWQAMGKIFV